jgi:deaminated glutathione amidase
VKKIAAIQMTSTHLVEENLTIAANLIQKASQAGATLVVLPEMFPIFGHQPTDKVKVKENFGEGKIQSFLSEQAKKHNIWLVGGTIPLACSEKDKIKAACLLYNHHGEVVARYDKIHLFDVVIAEHESYLESASTQPGNQLVVVDTPIGKLGLAVCYDLRFPEMFTHLFQKGAEILAIPAAFTVKTGEAHWQLLVRSRAIDTFCYVIGACQGGSHTNGRKTYGHSLIIDPWGAILAEHKAPGSGVIYAEVDLHKLHQIRKTIPLKAHQQLFENKK